MDSERTACRNSSCGLAILTMVKTAMPLLGRDSTVGPPGHCHRSSCGEAYTSAPGLMPTARLPVGSPNTVPPSIVVFCTHSGPGVGHRALDTDTFNSAVA